MAASVYVGGAEIPTISPGELTVEVLTEAISRQSCLLVRGLMPEQYVDDMVAGTDRALYAYQCREAGDTDPALNAWRFPFVPEGSHDSYAPAPHMGERQWYGFRSRPPNNFTRLLDICNSMGVLELPAGYFGVRPLLSGSKTTLKRVSPDTLVGWHQEINAYGAKTRAINMWVALSPCGKDARGLALVPVNAGGPVEDVPPPPPLLSISDATCSGVALEGTHAHEPLFEKGDVLFFDTLLPHTTQQGEGFTKERYAMECWFFSPTTVDEAAFLVPVYSDTLWFLYFLPTPCSRWA